MTEEDDMTNSFQDEADRLVFLAQLLDDIDLEKLLHTVSQADALGPILHPGEYRDAIYRGHLHAIEELARLAIPVRDSYRRLAARVQVTDAPS